MKTCRQRDHRSARMEKNDGRYHRYRRGDRIVRDSPSIIPSTGTYAGAKPSLKGKFRCLGLLSGICWIGTEPSRKETFRCLELLSGVCWMWLGSVPNPIGCDSPITPSWTSGIPSHKVKFWCLGLLCWNWPGSDPNRIKCGCGSLRLGDLGDIGDLRVDLCSASDNTFELDLSTNLTKGCSKSWAAVGLARGSRCKQHLRNIFASSDKKSGILGTSLLLPILKTAAICKFITCQHKQKKWRWIKKVSSKSKKQSTMSFNHVSLEFWFLF